jgi:hypothetical protein
MPIVLDIALRGKKYVKVSLEDVERISVEEQEKLGKE